MFEEDRQPSEPATPDEMAAVRRDARSKWTEATRRHDPAYWEQLQTRFGVTAE